MFAVPYEKRGKRREDGEEHEDRRHVFSDRRNGFPLVSKRVSETGEYEHVERFPREIEGDEFFKRGLRKARKQVYRGTETGSEEPARKNGGSRMFRKKLFERRELVRLEGFFESDFFERPPSVPVGNPISEDVSDNAGHERIGEYFGDAEIALRRERSGGHDDGGSRNGQSQRRRAHHREEQGVLPDEEIGEEKIEHGV